HELKRAARLERPVREVTMVSPGHAEHAQVVEPDGEREPRPRPPEEHYPHDGGQGNGEERDCADPVPAGAGLRGGIYRGGGDRRRNRKKRRALHTFTVRPALSAPCHESIRRRSGESVEVRDTCSRFPDLVTLRDELRRRIPAPFHELLPGA